MGRTKGFKFKKTIKKMCNYCGREFMSSSFFIKPRKYCSDKCKLISWALKESKKQAPKKVLTIIFLLLICTTAHAEINYNALADAIKITENGHGSPKGELYGIHTVHYSSEAEAREICIRTCKHSFKDHPNDWTALAKKYCPVNWKNWKRMVLYFYKGVK